MFRKRAECPLIKSIISLEINGKSYKSIGYQYIFVYHGNGMHWKSILASEYCRFYSHAHSQSFIHLHFHFHLHTHAHHTHLIHIIANWSTTLFLWFHLANFIHIIHINSLRLSKWCVINLKQKLTHSLTQIQNTQHNIIKTWSIA